MPANDIDIAQKHQIVTRLKNAYKTAVANKYNRPHRPHKRFEDVSAWMKIADVCIRLNADPDVYIAAQFRLAVSTPFPNMLHGKKAESNYRSYLIAHNIDPDAVRETNTIPQALLIQRLENTKLPLQAHSINTEDISACATFITTWPEQFEALPVMLLYGSDDRVCRAFQEAARETLAANAYYYDAIKSLNLDSSSIFRECC